MESCPKCGHPMLENKITHLEQMISSIRDEVICYINDSHPECSDLAKWIRDKIDDSNVIKSGDEKNDSYQENK